MRFDFIVQTETVTFKHPGNTDVYGLTVTPEDSSLFSLLPRLVFLNPSKHTNSFFMRNPKALLHS